MEKNASEVESKARKRMAVILQVEAGLMSVTDGAKELGISRQAYYEWANRALLSMEGALEDRPNGRPPQPQDAEKENLSKELEETKADLDRAILALDIKGTLEMLRKEEALDRTSGRDAKKNTRPGHKAQRR